MDTGQGGEAGGQGGQGQLGAGGDGVVALILEVLNNKDRLIAGYEPVQCMILHDDACWPGVPGMQALGYAGGQGGSTCSPQVWYYLAVHLAFSPGEL